MKRTAMLICAVSFACATTATFSAGNPEAGKQKAAACVSCHGEDGTSPAGLTPQAPSLAGQYASYLVKALEDYQTGARQNAIMQGFAGSLTDQDRKDLAAFFSSQTGLNVVTE